MIEFIFPHRLHRLDYFLRGVIADVKEGILYSCIGTTGSEVLWVSIIVLWIYEVFFIILPRIRDIGMSGWWILIAFVPVVNILFSIILLFRAPRMLPNGMASA